MALHMVTMTHTAESCGWRSQEARDAYGNGFAALRTAASRNGASINGAWINAPLHRHYVLIDAASAHAVNAILNETGLLGFITFDVAAVEDFGAALQGQ